MPTIISCAVTGNITTRANHPELPCTPQEIAKACIDAARAGAAIVHIHVRHPDGRPSMELQHYRETVDRVRDADSEVIVNLTTGPGPGGLAVRAGPPRLLQQEPGADRMAAFIADATANQNCRPWTPSPHRWAS